MSFVPQLCHQLCVVVALGDVRGERGEGRKGHPVVRHVTGRSRPPPPQARLSTSIFTCVAFRIKFPSGDGALGKAAAALGGPRGHLKRWTWLPVVLCTSVCCETLASCAWGSCPCLSK